MSVRVLVTGGAAAMADALCANGAQVLAIDNLNDYYDPKLKLARIDHVSRHKSFTFERADVADEQTLRKLYGQFRPDSIVHMAAQAGKAYGEANLIGFLNILECARHLGNQTLGLRVE
jgi:UDP-glucuronate 4-epimerase